MLALHSTAHRLLPAAVLAVAVTLALIFLMQRLIADDDANIEALPPPVTIEYLANIPDAEVLRKTPPKRPPKVEPQPPIDRTFELTDSIGGPILEHFVPTRSGPDIGPRRLADGEPIPLFRAPPKYPGYAQQRGLEGSVLLELTIAATGQVIEAVVLEADPPKIFDRAAREAALKSRYRPKVVAGEAVIQRGVLNRVVFEMTR
ncbi:MAG: TonB family protein [Gammaproteobacteria bacterium]|nr:TonB family protein [Gammaproteobacteria bacterium]